MARRQSRIALSADRQARAIGDAHHKNQKHRLEGAWNDKIAQIAFEIDVKWGKSKTVMNDDASTFYEIARLGAGAMAETWLVYHPTETGTSQFYAFKTILPAYRFQREYLQLFYHEASVAMLLHHPNIVSTCDYGMLHGCGVMVMEPMSGVTLAELLQKAGALSPDLAIYVTLEMLEALDYLHAKTDASGTWLQIVHRDVCPANIHIGYDGHCRLFDFGVCQTLGRDLEIQRGMMVGTAAYMSPEQCRSLPVDGRSDLFSLGVVAVEMMTGKPLFYRENPIQIYDAIMHWEPEFSEVIPEAVVAVLKRALAKSREARFEDANAMAQALRPHLTISRERARQALSQIMTTCFAAQREREQSLRREAIARYASSSMAKTRENSPSTPSLHDAGNLEVAVSRLGDLRDGESTPTDGASNDQNKYKNVAEWIKKWIFGKP